MGNNRTYRKKKRKFAGNRYTGKINLKAATTPSRDLTISSMETASPKKLKTLISSKKTYKKENKSKTEKTASVTFVSGNAGKISEVQAILGKIMKVESVKLDLPEYQGEAEFITTAKCKCASEMVKRPIIVEDTSLCFDALHGLPGPYIKWFLDKLGPKGLHTLLSGWENKSASAVCTFAFCENEGHSPQLFKGVTRGIIVPPSGDSGFGWDSCFLPDGSVKTYAEMSKEEKNKISHRSKALALLKSYFEQKNLSDL